MVEDLFDGWDLPAVAVADTRRKTPLPHIPDLGWRAPTELPNLSAARVISLDTETWDPELLDKGPGWARGKGHIVGVSIAVDEVNKWYFPLRHEVSPELNMDPAMVLRWLQDALGNRHQMKVGANLIYDLGWLRQEGVRVQGPLFDVLYAEALLSEAAKISLDSVSSKYLGATKETSVLYQWLAQAYGGKPNDKQRANMFRSPPQLAGPYAQTDAVLPLQLVQPMTQQLVNEGLYHIQDLECSLIPLLLDMRFAGVRVDLDRAEQARGPLIQHEQELSAQLREWCGFEVNVNAADSVAKAFDKFHIKYPKSATGKPSFKKEFLDTVEHPLGDLIVERRNVEKMRSTFLEGYILNAHVNGFVYGQFHPLRSADGGTRSGRFSSSDPNLQNLPSRDDILAPLLRGIFIPDDGHIGWRKFDYSQIEYRLLIHYACGVGSEEARAYFRAHPETDYHERAIDLVAPEAGWDVSTPELRKKWRKPVKNINFGFIYGMGPGKLGRSLGLNPKEAKDLFAAYHRGVPFAKATMDATSQEAARTGYVATYLGRRRRFELWEEDGYGKREESWEPLPYDQAIHKWSRVRRAMLHKALNSKLQGSAADMFKVALVKCYNDGVFDVIGVPRLLVHDESDFSDNGVQGSEEAYSYMKHVMETALPLSIPIKVEEERGPDWGHTH